MRQAQRSEILGGVQIVLSGLVDHSQKSLARGGTVKQDLIYLPWLQILSAITPKAKNKLRSNFVSLHALPPKNRSILQLSRTAVALPQKSLE